MGFTARAANRCTEVPIASLRRPPFEHTCYVHVLCCLVPSDDIASAVIDEYGVRCVFSIALRIIAAFFDHSRSAFPFPFDEANADGLNYLAGRDIAEIATIAADAVRDAHVTGGVPNIVIHVDKRDEEGFASLVCFFELACAISGYMSRVNPFDQPGVEAYKKNMFRMLGKPGAV